MNFETDKREFAPAWGAPSARALPARGKRCPRCGELLFEDMDVCYGCLYDFTREPYHLPEGMIGGTSEVGATRDEMCLPAIDEPFGLEGRGERMQLARLASAPKVFERQAPAHAPQATPAHMPAGVAMPYMPATVPAAVATSPTPAAESASASTPASSPQRMMLATPELSVALPLPFSGLRLGSAPDNDVVLMDGDIAGHHLLLLPRKGDVIAVGLVGGAFRGDGGVSEDCAVLHSGDSITLGGATLCILPLGVSG